MQQNIETVKAMYAAFSSGDIPGVMQHVADNVVWAFEAPSALTWSGIRRGKQDTLGFFAGLAGQLADMHLEMTEFLTGGDVVASFGRFQGTVKGSGIRVDTPVAHYFKVVNGKVVEYRNFVNSGAFIEALAAKAVHA